MAIQSNFPAIKPSLVLDFQNTKQLDPRITFTRASTATFYNGVTTAMAEQNLFTYSQDFDDAVWVKVGASVTANATTAPDGTTTADSLVSTATPASVYINRTPTLTASQPYVMSFYVKANTANFIQIITASAIVPSGYVNFNVTSGAGAIGNYGGTGITPSIVDVGNGWYRCVLTIASVAGSGIIEFHLVDSATAARSATYSGTIGTGVYLWGSQLENRSAISAYTATTTQAITNYIPVLQTAASGVARFDNNPTTGESLGLLIEEQRTNIQTYSGSATGWTFNTNTTPNLANAQGIAPDGTNTAVGIPYGATGNVQSNLTVTSDTNTYTFSFYAKSLTGAGTITTGTLGFPPPNNYFAGTIFNFSTLALGSGWSATAVGNGWYRLSRSFINTSQTTFINAVSTTTGVVLLWGPQLELGAFATSYIPTVASQVTRAADAASMTGTNFSSWFNNGEGTIYADFTRLTLVSSSQFSISDGTNTNYIQSVSSGTGAFEQAIISTNGTIVFNYGPTAVLSGKIVMAYKFNDSAASLNAATATTDTSVTIPAVNQLSIANSTTNNRLNGTIKKLAYYPIRVTNTQLQALTS